MAVEKKERVAPETDEVVEKAEEKTAETADTKETVKEDSVSAELENLQAELDKQKDLLLRTAAEYDNYRKRTKREKELFFADAKASTLSPLLPVFDSLERAMDTDASSLEDYKKGVTLVGNQLKECLKQLGVEEIGVSGEAFDPEKHNAVSQDEKDGAEENTIALVLQKGYSVDGKILRHAVVSVYK